MGYRVLHAWGTTFDDAERRLKEQVDAYMEAGWTVSGSVSISVRKKDTGEGTIYEDSTDLAQAMVCE